MGRESVKRLGGSKKRTVVRIPISPPTHYRSLYAFQKICNSNKSGNVFERENGLRTDCLQNQAEIIDNRDCLCDHYCDRQRFSRSLKM